jgi:hypothetical protein
MKHIALSKEKIKHLHAPLPAITTPEGRRRKNLYPELQFMTSICLNVTLYEGEEKKSQKREFRSCFFFSCT